MQLAFFEFDPQARSAAGNIERIVEGCRDLTRTLVALPELFLSSYTVPEPIDESSLDEILAPLCALTVENNVSFVGSLPVATGNGTVNRALFLANRKVIRVYDKLCPFGSERETITAGGDPPRVYSFYNVGFSAQICFDNVSPLPSREMSLNGMDVLVAPSAVSVTHLRDILRARALENQIITIFCNRTGAEADGTQYCGGSAIFFPDGTSLPARRTRTRGARLVTNAPASNFFVRLEKRRLRFFGGSG